ncbi:MAG: hypothetical protein U5O16_01055 [Rhodococcus sp. (in: high G+C Gram-positive bacteria)]|uniref:hypothetical protein n=1 Tax=Rhodococcus sp. TaxID=1831 RepID=UPI002AD5C910|nr:hypothetical protein [Rhodococcus sp. (in: high G+C Gram-positive bacteria)]
MTAQDPQADAHAQELRRVALQSTAEVWRGLDVLDAELRAGQFASARGTVRALRELVKITDASVTAVTRYSSTVGAAIATVREIRCGYCNNPLTHGPGNCVSDAGRPHVYDEADLRAALDGPGG